MIIKIVIFDWGDVIGFYDLSRFDEFLKKNNCFKPTSSFFKENKPDFDIGKLSEEEFWTRLKEHTSFSGTWQELAVGNQHNLIINLNNLDLVKTIKEKRKTILLSNMDPSSVIKIKKEIPLKDYFDKHYFSFELRQHKMNKEVLSKITEEFKVNPDEVLFIDDFEGNIEKAKEFGFKTIQYLNETQLSKELKELLN